MKIRQTLLHFIVLICLASTLGCGLLAGSLETPAPVDNLVATSVAVTVAAGASLNAPTDTPTVQPLITDTSSPEPVPLATATSAEQPFLPSESSLLVAYVDLNRNLWSRRTGEAARQLTTSGDVENLQVSGDGAWIAFTRTTNFYNYSLWAIQPDGREEKALMDQPDFETMPKPPGAISVMPFSFAWQPGTHILAFNTRPTFEGPGLMLNDDLWLVNADTGERNQLLLPGEGGIFSFSSDGSRIAISTPEDISLVDADGGNRQTAILTFPQISTYSEYLYYPVAQWSPGSDFLRVVIPPEASLDNPEDPSQVWQIPADGSDAWLVGRFQTMPLIYPVLSPNLEKAAYLRQVGDPAENRRELHIASIDGSEDIVYLTESYLIFAAWEPNSEQFAFMVGDNLRPYLGQVGMTPVPLTDVSGATDVRWVDSDSFLFISRSSSSIELRLGSVGGSSELIASISGNAVPFLHYDFAH